MKYPIRSITVDDEGLIGEVSVGEVFIYHDMYGADCLGIVSGIRQENGSTYMEVRVLKTYAEVFEHTTRDLEPDFNAVSNTDGYKKLPTEFEAFLTDEFIDIADCMLIKKVELYEWKRFLTLMSAPGCSGTFPIPLNSNYEVYYWRFAYKPERDNVLGRIRVVENSLLKYKGSEFPTNMNVSCLSPSLSSRTMFL